MRLTANRSIAASSKLSRVRRELWFDVRKIHLSCIEAGIDNLRLGGKVGEPTRYRNLFAGLKSTAERRLAK